MSFIYDTRCSECNSGIGIIEAEIDNDQDISLRIEPCSECIKNAVEEEREKHDSPS